MALDIAAVQDRLRKAGLDGWLLYDFHGSNPIAARLAGLTTGRHMTTRRWYYLIPATGQPRGLVHAIERHNLDALPGERVVYAGRQQLDTGLTQLLAGLKRVAMEYSPMCAIPYLSRVDAGTVEMVRARGVDVVSSGDLVQQFEAAWTDEQLATHRAASESLYRIKDRAFAMASDAMARGRSLNEFELQQQMMQWFDEEGLVTDSPPVVAVGGNAGDPHYLPTADQCRAVVPNEVLLLDLWGTDWDAWPAFPRRRTVRLSLRRYRTGGHGIEVELELEPGPGRYVLLEPAGATFGSFADLPEALDRASQRAAAAAPPRPAIPPPRPTLGRALVVLAILVGALALIAAGTLVTLWLQGPPAPQKLDTIPPMPGRP